MKKQYTDAEIKNILKELAEFVPEINASDTEWGAFLREFIATRPHAEMDERFALELREQLLQRAEHMQSRRFGRLPQWLKFSAPFALGAAVCAAVIVPILQEPETFNAEEDVAPVMMRSMKAVPEMAMAPEMGDMQLTEVVQLVEVIEEFDVTPVMQLADIADEDVVIPVVEPMASGYSSEPETTEDLSEDIPTGAMMKSIQHDPEPEVMNMAIPVEEPMMDMAAPQEKFGVMDMAMPETMEMDGAMMPEEHNFGARVPMKLLWEDVPSEEEILRVAIEAFEHQGYKLHQFDEPFIDKSWERSEHNIHEEFAPEIMGVVFISDREEVRIEINVISMEVVRILRSE